MGGSTSIGSAAVDPRVDPDRELADDVRDAAAGWPGADESAAGYARPGMLGYEPVVGHAGVADRAREDTAHGDLAPTSIAYAGGRVASIPEGMTAIVHEPFGRAVAFHERPNPACSTPAVGALTTPVGAVDPGAPGPIHLRNRRGTHGAFVLADHVAGHMELVDTTNHLVHVNDHAQGVWH